jgi:hypothetical protein
MLSFAEPGFCQQAASFLITSRKLKPVDSIDYRTKIQYFPVISVNREDYILSVDESKIEFMYGVPYTSAKYNYLKVPVTLTNASETTLRYFSMSGSWWDIYRTDNPNLKVFAQHSCYKNLSVILSLSPHQYIKRDVIIEVPKKESVAIAFKIGIMILQKELDNDYSINAKPTQPLFSTPGMQRLIWSNYVMISQWHAIKNKNI